MKLASLLLLAASLTGCSGNPPSPQTVTNTVNGVDLAICVLGDYAIDLSSGMTVIAATEDVVVKCKTDEVTVANVLAAHARASKAEAAAAARSAK